MSKITLVDKSQCTSCGACKYVCPTNSISFVTDEMDNTFPVINYDKCVSCAKCQKACHVNNQNLKLYTPQKCYVAWNSDNKLRFNAASGGIATAIYDFCISNGYKSFGVALSIADGAYYKEITRREDLKDIQNSKYTFSNIADIFGEIIEYVEAGEKVIIPALPCQAAALRTLCGEKKDNLIIIDIVCHGVCPYEYLKQHIKRVIKKQVLK